MNQNSKIAMEMAYLAGMNQQLHPKPPQTRGGESAPPTPNFAGSATLKTSTVNSYALVLNCENYAVNYMFEKNMIPNIVATTSTGIIGFSLPGTPVNWYSGNASDYDGAQYLIDFSVLNKLEKNILYSFSIEFEINGIKYTQPVNPSDVQISLANTPVSAEIQNINNQLSIKLS